MKKKNDQGFSLIEVLVAIVVLAAFVIPTCSALVLSARMNAKTEALLQSQLAVSSAVETLMAKGVDEDFCDALAGIDSGEYPEIDPNQEYKKSNHIDFLAFDVLWKVSSPSEDPWYTVSVISTDGLVEVTTSIRKVS